MYEMSVSKSSSSVSKSSSSVSKPRNKGHALHSVAETFISAAILNKRLCGRRDSSYRNFTNVIASVS